MVSMPAKHFIKFLLIFFVLLSFAQICFADVDEEAQKYQEFQKYDDEGMNYFNAGQYDKAVESLKEAIRIRPDNAHTYYWLGHSYGRLGDNEKKVEAFKKAAELLNKSIKSSLSSSEFFKVVLGWDVSSFLADDYYWLASSYAELGQYDKAVDALKEAIKLKPDYESAYVSLAFNYERMGQYDNAIEAYQEAIKLQPDDPSPYNFLAFNYRRTGQYEKAVEEYNKSIELKPDNASPYSGLGYAYMGLKQYEKAIEAFKKAISINPEAHYDIGFAYFDMKQYEDAIQSFKEAIKLKPEDADLHYSFATVYTSIGKPNDALIQLKIAQSIYNKSSNKAGEAKCFDAMGRASSKLNKDIDALNYFQKALTVYNELGNLKEVANMLIGIAGEYSSLSEYDMVLKYQQKALELYKQNNDFENITLVLGDIARIKLFIHETSDDNKEAIKDAEQAIEIAKQHNLQNTPNIYTPYFALTLAYGADKDYERALSYAEKLLSVSQQYNITDFVALSLILIGAIYSEKEDYQQAQTYYLRAANFSNEITAAHTTWNLYHGIGYISDKLGDMKEAKKQYLNAINILETSRENAQSLAAKTSIAISANGVYENTILFFLKTNEPDEAFNYMERAKARTFLDLLGSKSKLQDNIIFEEERRLQFRINYLTEKIKEAHEKPDKKDYTQMEIALGKQLNDTRTEYAALIEKVKKENPELSTLLTVNPLTLKEVQELLDVD
jgi:tetratricopeptide (TPR) repeat protein